MTSNSAGRIGNYAATVSASSEDSASYAAWKAFDGTTAEWWSSTGTFTNNSGDYDEISTNWLKIDFGSGAYVAIDGFKLDSETNGFDSGCGVDEVYLEGSNDNSSWTLIEGSEYVGSMTSEVTQTWSWSN